MPIPTWCTLAKGDQVSVMRKHADDLRKILDHCFAPATRSKLRVVGSGWSFSSVVEPKEVVLDAGAMTFMHKERPHTRLSPKSC